MAPLAAANLTGTWIGTGTDAQGAETFTWSITQSGDRISGSVVLDSANRNDGSCGITMHASTGDVTAGRIAAAYTGTTTCEGPITDGTLTVTR